MTMTLKEEIARDRKHMKQTGEACKVLDDARETFFWEFYNGYNLRIPLQNIIHQTIEELGWSDWYEDNDDVLQCLADEIIEKYEGDRDDAAYLLRSWADRHAAVGTFFRLVALKIDKDKALSLIE